MFNISSVGIIELTRGDSFKVPLFINQGNDIAPVRYTLNEKDVLYFAVMEPNQIFEEADIKKVFTSSDEMTETQDLYISLKSSDTENLLPGKYFYTIKLVQNKDDGSYDVTTIIPQTEFYILR